MGKLDLPPVVQFLKAGRGGLPDVDKDFANPGKKTDPSFSRFDFSQTGNDATFTGEISDFISSNGDLVVRVGIEAAHSGSYTIQATLQDSSGNLQFVTKPLSLGVQLHEIDIVFPGSVLAARRNSGPFVLSELSITDANSETFFPSNYHTGDYQADEFIRGQTILFQEISDAELFVGGPTATIDIGFTLSSNEPVPGVLHVSGYLHSEDGAFLGRAETAISISEPNPSGSLSFDASKALLGRKYGSLELRNIRVLRDNGFLHDFVSSSAVPLELTPEAVATRNILMSTAYVESLTEVVDGDAVESLDVSIPISVQEPGRYSIVANLSNRNGDSISRANQFLELSTEQSEIKLSFESQRFIDARSDGPFFVDQLAVYGSDGLLIDLLPNVPIVGDLAWGQWTSDRVRPSSALDPIDAQQRRSTFNLSWSGEDSTEGTGVRSFDVYVSENGMPFELLIGATSNTSVLFSGGYGRTYRFYTVARDNALNLEEAPTSGYIETALVSPWLNIVEPFDVNGKDGVSALDALIIINALNRSGSFSLTVPDQVDESEVHVFLDTTGDGIVSALDALRVINQLNRISSSFSAVSSPEAEQIYFPSKVPQVASLKPTPLDHSTQIVFKNRRPIESADLSRLDPREATFVEMDDLTDNIRRNDLALLNWSVEQPSELTLCSENVFDNLMLLGED